MISSSSFKCVLKSVLITLRMYRPVKIIVDGMRSSRIYLRSRFSTIDCRSSNFQIQDDRETVAAIISCYNYFDYTKQAIDSYYKCINNNYNFALIVMDDHSTDQTNSFGSVNFYV